jgi:hypothetical protein
MPAQGICLRVTHTGAVKGPLLVTDIHDGIDANGRVQANKPGAVYIPFNGVVDLIYTSQVAHSFEVGAIRAWINTGYLTAVFVFGTSFHNTITQTSSIIVQDEGVPVETETTTLNFIGGNVTATPVGGGVVDVVVVGGGASTYWNVLTTLVDRVATNSEFILIDSDPVTITLPVPNVSDHIAVKVITPTITNIQVKTHGAGVLIDGTDYSVTGLPLTTQWEQVNFISNGTNWFIW